MNTSVKTYFKPKTIQEAAELALKNNVNTVFVSGGTDFWVNNFHGNKTASCVIDLSQVESMKSFEIKNGYLCIGAQMSLEEVTKIPMVKSDFSTLIEAIKAIATPVIRKTATIGGNLLCENRCSFYNQTEFWRKSVGYCLKCEGDICIATGGDKACFSKLVSDTAPVLLSWDASIEIFINGKQQRIKLSSIYSCEGIKPVLLPENAILTSVHIPLQTKFKTHFNKLRKRLSLDFTSLSTAVTIYEQNKVRIVMVGIDPGPVIIEGLLTERDELIKHAIKKARIVDNDVFSRKYRKSMIPVFLNNSFDALMKN